MEFFVSMEIVLNKSTNAGLKFFIPRSEFATTAGFTTP